MVHLTERLIKKTKVAKEGFKELKDNALFVLATSQEAKKKKGEKWQEVVAYILDDELKEDSDEEKKRKEEHLRLAIKCWIIEKLKKKEEWERKKREENQIAREKPVERNEKRKEKVNDEEENEVPKKKSTPK